MIKYTKYKPNGEARIGTCPISQFDSQILVEGESIIEGHFPDDLYYFVNDVPVLKETPPSSNYDWNENTKEWDANIEKARLHKKYLIENKRNTLIDADILYDGHIFQADDAYSIRQIQKKLTEIQAVRALGTTISPMLWRDKNNDDYFWEDLDIFETWLNNFVVVIANRTTSITVASFVHKNNLSTLTTVEDIENYDHTINW